MAAMVTDGYLRTLWNPLSPSASFDFDIKCVKRQPITYVWAEPRERRLYCLGCESILFQPVERGNDLGYQRG
ncbi:uncharacterized protein BDV14DRAFT_163545 [Aspergillus stella-maris]|uniref:uncharacterized protein n=1 Tax=Aspergillus stella-maris TaxID=1810926 RepID=UPI003CCDA352